MYLVRKITRSKWERTDQLGDNEIPADGITADLRSTNNALSLWACADASESLDDAVLALAAGFERIDKIEVIWIDRESLKAASVKLDKTQGRTPVADLVDRHIDAVQLDLIRLGRFAEQVSTALKAGQYRRLTKKQVARLIATAVEDGRVALDDLQEKVKIAVSEYVKRDA